MIRIFVLMGLIFLAGCEIQIKSNLLSPGDKAYHTVLEKEVLVLGSEHIQYGGNYHTLYTIQYLNDREEKITKKVLWFDLVKIPVGENSHETKS